MVLWPRTSNSDFQIDPRRSSTDTVTRLAVMITDWWKWAVVGVVGLLVLAAAIVAYSVWGSKTETDAATLLSKAATLLETNSTGGPEAAKREEGIRLLQEVINRYPRSGAAAEATLRLGAHYYSLGNFNEARKVFTAYLEKNPNGQIAFSAGLGLGDAFLAERNYEKAIEIYTRLINQFPKDPLLPEAQLHLATAYQGAKRVTEARALYEKIVAAYPNTGWAQRAQTEFYKFTSTSP